MTATILHNLDLFIFLILLLCGYIVGSLSERRHYRSIEARERALLRLAVVTAEGRFDPYQVKDAFLVNGSVVISTDYFKRLLAILRNIFGGRVKAYESLVDRARREAILRVVREEGILILEDAPYVYINFAPAANRPRPFLAMDPRCTIHLFTGSKIGFPGPRVGFLYSEAELAIAGGRTASLTEFALTEASADMLFQNPAALLGFEALLHDDDFSERRSLWPVAETKLAVYRENRSIMLDGLERELGGHRDLFHWTDPKAGFFTVFTFLGPGIRTDDAFDHGVVVIPMYDFYPEDARRRDPDAGFDQLRLSFCFSESLGEQRRTDLEEAVAAFCAAAKKLAGV